LNTESNINFEDKKREDISNVGCFTTGKFQCKSCKFIFYNNNRCTQCGSSEIIQIIED
jgi:hypothetical protein